MSPASDQLNKEETGESTNLFDCGRIHSLYFSNFFYFLPTGVEKVETFNTEVQNSFQISCCHGSGATKQLPTFHSSSSEFI